MQPKIFDTIFGLMTIHIYFKIVKSLLNAEKFINNDCFISVGSTRNIKNQRTYGGMKNLNYKIRIFKNKVVKPNSKYQNINRFNGNIV